MQRPPKKSQKKTTPKKTTPKKESVEDTPVKKTAPIESKAEKFAKLFKNRTNKLLHQMVNLGKLANISNYDIEREFVVKGLNLISEELADLKHKFELIFTKQSKRQL